MDEDTLTRAIASAWARHAQRVRYQWPGGCGGYAHLQTPEVMAELGFQQAVREVASLVLAEQRERLRGLVQAVRDANAAAGDPERFRLLTHAQQTAWLQLLAALDGPNVELSGLGRQEQK
jgi:hypothetical protein